MTLKLDMSKTCDCVEWGYLRTISLKMGFDIILLNFFMTSVITAHYQISHTEFGSIIPERGARQGDPYPLIFFLYVWKFLLCY